jgi:GTP-binding protein
MEYIQTDEAIEITPNFIRMRKKILREEDRKREERTAKA